MKNQVVVIFAAMLCLVWGAKLGGLERQEKMGLTKEGGEKNQEDTKRNVKTDGEKTKKGSMKRFLQEGKYDTGLDTDLLKMLEAEKDYVKNGNDRQSEQYQNYDELDFCSEPYIETEFLEIKFDTFPYSPDMNGGLRSSTSPFYKYMEPNYFSAYLEHLASIIDKTLVMYDKDYYIQLLREAFQQSVAAGNIMVNNHEVHDDPNVTGKRVKRTDNLFPILKRFAQLTCDPEKENCPESAPTLDEVRKYDIPAKDTTSDKTQKSAEQPANEEVDINSKAAGMKSDIEGSAVGNDGKNIVLENKEKESPMIVQIPNEHLEKNKDEDVKTNEGYKKKPNFEIVFRMGDE